MILVCRVHTMMNSLSRSPVLGAIALALEILLVPHAAAQSSDAALTARIDRVLAQTPLIDGHNDLPWEIRERFDSANGVD